MAMRAASICRASSQIGSSACSANSPNATVLPLCAVPFMRPRCCLRYLVRFGANNMVSAPIGRPLPPRRVSFPVHWGVTPSRGGPRPAAAPPCARVDTWRHVVARLPRELLARFVRRGRIVGRTGLRLGCRDIRRLRALALVRGWSGELVCARRRDHQPTGGQWLTLARFNAPLWPRPWLAARRARSARGPTPRHRPRPAATPLAAGALTCEIGGRGGARRALADSARVSVTA